MHYSRHVYMFTIFSESSSQSVGKRGFPWRQISNQQNVYVFTVYRNRITHVSYILPKHIFPLKEKEVKLSKILNKIIQNIFKIIIFILFHFCLYKKKARKQNEYWAFL